MATEQESSTSGRMDAHTISVPVPRRAPSGGRAAAKCLASVLSGSPGWGGGAAWGARVPTVSCLIVAEVACSLGSVVGSALLHPSARRKELMTTSISQDLEVFFVGAG